MATERFLTAQMVNQRISKLVRRALGGGGPRHHGYFEHSLGGVIDGHHTITINHPVCAHHITAVRSWQAEGDYRCGKANRAGRPVFSSINGVGPRSAEAGPTHFAVGKFDLWKTRPSLAITPCQFWPPSVVRCNLASERTWYPVFASRKTTSQTR